MSGEYSSETSLKFVHSQPNAEVNDYESQRLSQKSSRQSSERESSIGKGRPLVRKPNNQVSNLQSYKSIKRKSQQKLFKNNMDAPPRYPKSGQELRQSDSSTKISTNEESSSTKKRKADNNEDIIKFKKKPLTKEEIIEIKDYVQGLEKEESEINSVAGTEKPILNTQIDPPLMKQLNKKSKTQYFHIQDFQKQEHYDVAESENLSESDRNFIVSLKQKCKSVDENNTLLQKRISWLREQVEMHLQRQLRYEKDRTDFEKSLLEKDKQAKERDNVHLKEKQLLKKDIELRDLEIEKLKAMFIDLHNRFEDDKQIMSQQMDFLKNEKESEYEQKLKCEEKIKELEDKIYTLIQQKKQIEFNSLNTSEQYSKSFLEKILNENKYLKVETHTLSKYKDEVIKFQRELKRVSNQRDNLKKKIIESAKREMKKYRQNLDEDSQDSSEFFMLSQISTPSTSFKKI